MEALMVGLFWGMVYGALAMLAVWGGAWGWVIGRALLRGRKAI